MNKFNIGRFIIGILVSVLAIIAIFTVYGIGYNMLNDTEYANFFGYYAHEVDTDNMAPDYKINDLVILKEDYSFNTDDVVVYKSKTTYKIGKIVDLAAGEYKVTDNVESVPEDFVVTTDGIVGKVVFRLSGFATTFNILSSPVTVVISAILVFAYFFLTTGDRDKWQ